MKKPCLPAGRKKILFIWHAAVVRSYQQYIAELAEHHNLDITLLIPQGSVEGSKYHKAYKPHTANYKVIVGYAHYPKDPLISIYPALPYYLWKVKPDLIHMFEEPYHNLAAYLTFWKKIICPKAKFIFQTFQNQIEDYRKSWVKIQNKTFAASGAAIACAEEMKQVLLHWGYKKPIYVVYPGIETNLFAPKDDTGLRKTLELDKFTIGFAGRMLEEKGIEDIINAGKLLKFPYQLLFIGDGKDKAKFKKLTDKAVWIDAQPPGKMNKYYNCMDVLVLPSRTTKKWKEQFGRVIIEAMLCGVPVIGSSSGEIPRVIGDAGLIFKEQDSQELAERITSLYESAPLRNELAERGLSYAKQFDWKYVADKVHKIYMSLLYE